TFNSFTNPPYSKLWSKYRPVLLNLMVASEFEPQNYKLFFHEFKSLNSKQKDFSFTLQAFKGKPINDIRASAIANDLLQVLSMSQKASQLMDEYKYEFSMDRNFLLRVSRLQEAN
ncbi:MAG: hypothetical protein HC859_16380, partial [Bacteroidia bacterium]|nr:hypothetical protein [Bacteroidia bacterium]